MHERTVEVCDITRAGPRDRQYPLLVVETDHSVDAWDPPNPRQLAYELQAEIVTWNLTNQVVDDCPCPRCR